MSHDVYTPPKVWTWEAGQGGRFENINRPTAGATHDHELPVGEHPFQLYSIATPNGVKVTVMLEELLAAGVSEAEYDAWLINIMDGVQFGSGFVDINPNSKIPALLDRSTDPAVRVFESGSILLHLAEKFDMFLPSSGPARTEVMNWVMWHMGAVPFLGGGFGHFYNYAPEKYEYSINRYAMEVKRQLDLLDKHLEKSEFIVGSDYTIADISIWPWYGAMVLGKLYSAAEFLQVHEYTHLLRWANQLRERTAVQRGVIVNRAWGEEGDAKLLVRNSAADIDAALAAVSDGN